MGVLTTSFVGLVVVTPLIMKSMNGLPGHNAQRTVLSKYKPYLHGAIKKQMSVAAYSVT
jgi:hypothetical protein